MTFDRVPLRVATISSSLTGANNRSLREVVIRCKGVYMWYAEVLGEDMYRFYETFNITHFTITSCSVAVMRPGFQQYFPHLTHLNISHNFLNGDKIALFGLLLLRHLTVFDVSWQHTGFDFNDNKFLNSFKLVQNSKPCFGLPPLLTALYVRNALANLNLFNFCSHANNSLTILDISGNYKDSFTEPMVGYHSLEYLYMESIKLKYFPNDMFTQVPMLKNVSLAHNMINDVIEKDEGIIFRNNSNLNTLNLAFCSIENLSNMFMYSIRAIEYLHLEGNHLDTLFIGHLYRLKFLNVSFNRFINLPDHFIESLNRISRESNITIDLANNPLSSIRTCCDIPNFIRMYLKGNINFIRSEKFTCVLSNEIKYFSTLSLETLKSACDSEITLSKVEMEIFLTVGVFIAVIITMAVLIYRNKWCIKAYVLAGKRYLKGHKGRYSQEKYTFDAFVSYHATNSSWVRKVLLYHMETIQKLHICLHERDFIPGMPIAENISNAIDSSKRVILIISEAFTKSRWCLMEMEIARQRAIERGSDIFIPIILQQINDSDGNRTLFNILRQNTYLEWPHDDTEGQAFFLQRLSEAIKSNVDDLVP